MKAAILDFDGTIIDSMGDIYRILTELTRKYNLAEIEPPILGELSGRPLREILRAKNPTVNPSLVRRIEEELFDRYTEICKDERRLFPKVRETLEALRSKGVRLAVVSTTPRKPLEYNLECSHLEGNFEVVLAREDVERPKPAPDGILKALRLLGVERGEVIFVGDSPVDIIAGRAAGVRTVAVLTGLCPRARLEAEKPDAIIVDISYLPDYLAKSSVE